MGADGPSGIWQDNDTRGMLHDLSLDPHDSPLGTEIVPDQNCRLVGMETSSRTFGVEEERDGKHGRRMN